MLKGLMLRISGRHVDRREGLVERHVNGMHVWLPADFIAMFDHCREPTGHYSIETQHFRRTLDRLSFGGVAVDVGASGGIFTVGFSRKVGLEGAVYAFEPAHGASRWLEQTVQGNWLNNVIVERAAISDANGQTDFFEVPRTEHCTWRPEASALQLAHPANDATKYEVPVVMLDSYFGEFSRRIDVIKIDIEGFEARALRGGIDTIRRFSPFLSIDIHARVDGPGDTEPEVRAILEPL